MHTHFQSNCHWNFGRGKIGLPGKLPTNQNYRDSTVKQYIPVMIVYCIEMNVIPEKFVYIFNMNGLQSLFHIYRSSRRSHVVHHPGCGDGGSGCGHCHPTRLCLLQNGQEGKTKVSYSCHGNQSNHRLVNFVAPHGNTAINYFLQSPWFQILFV